MFMLPLVTCLFLSNSVKIIHSCYLKGQLQGLNVQMKIVCIKYVKICRKLGALRHSIYFNVMLDLLTFFIDSIIFPLTLGWLTYFNACMGYSLTNL